MSYGETKRSEMRYRLEKAIRPVRRYFFHLTDDGDLCRVVAWGLVAICAFATFVIWLEGAFRE